MIQRVGDSADNIIASAGEDLEMECIATGGNPSPTLRWYADDQEIRSGHTQVLMFDCLIWGKVLLPSEKINRNGNQIIQFFSKYSLKAKPYANIRALNKRKAKQRNYYNIITDIGFNALVATQSNYSFFTREIDRLNDF